MIRHATYYLLGQMLPRAGCSSARAVRSAAPEVPGILLSLLRARLERRAKTSFLTSAFAHYFDTHRGATE
jgi:hypothetical protein